jgi:hypothetical protein
LLIEAFLFFLLVTAGEAAVPDQKNVPGDPVMPFLSDRRSGIVRGRGAPVLLHVCVLVLGYLGFRDSSVNVMVGWILMVLVGITVSQPMLLLVGCDAGANKRFVEPKLLEWLQSGVASWRGDSDEMLLECGGLDCSMFAKEGGGSSRVKSGMALAPNPVLKKLEGLL